MLDCNCMKLYETAGGLEDQPLFFLLRFKTAGLQGLFCFGVCVPPNFEPEQHLNNISLYNKTKQNTKTSEEHLKKLF